MKSNRFLIFLVMALFLLGAGATSGNAAGTHQPGDAAPQIHLLNYTFDPLEGLPGLPDGMALALDAPESGSTYLVQFSGPVEDGWKQAIEAAGGILADYIPDYAFIAHLDPEARARVEALPFVRWVGLFQPAYKMPKTTADAAGAALDQRSYRVILAPWVDHATAVDDLALLGIGARDYGSGLSAVLTGAQVSAVTRMDGVTWVEPYTLQKAFNDVGGKTIMGASVAWTNGYTGSGVTVNVTDTGLDTGNPATIHSDFAGRVSHISSWPVLSLDLGGGCYITNAGANDGAADVSSGHGTHVTGSATGGGARSGGAIKGLAYQAAITFQAIEQYTTFSAPCLDRGISNGYYLTAIPDDIGLLMGEAYNWGARVQNESWGGGAFGAYDQQAAYFDTFINSHKDMTVVVAAGNSGEDADWDGYVDENSISSPASAKNVITIGATDSERSYGSGYAGYSWFDGWGYTYPMNPTSSDLISDNRGELAAFSSRGPMNDGRIKPDLVAPGTDILSTRSSQASGYGWGYYNPYYEYMGGTSMASPLSTGAAALVRDFYLHHYVINPSAALIKATLVNSAVDIPGYGNPFYEAGQPIPNNHEGWGRIDVGAATTAGSRKYLDSSSGVSTGGSYTETVTVSAGSPFKVTLVWSDYPAAALAGTTLVNNLNLRVTAPDGTTVYYGNNFSGGWSIPGVLTDTKNNIENVYIQNPTAGAWTIEVLGQNVPVGPQPFALVYNGSPARPYHMYLSTIRK